MIDSDMKPWLIEVNTNPCLETCCPLLCRLISHLIENTIRIMNVYYPDLTYDAIIANDCNKAFIIKYK